MGRAPSHKKARYGAKTTQTKTVCEQQFPDCPETPNHETCASCPLWGTGESKQYRYKEKEEASSNETEMNSEPKEQTGSDSL